MHRLWLIILLLFCSNSKVWGEASDKITVNSVKSDDDLEIKPFVPTKEWQRVKKGQAIPAGIHSRLNLQTGVVEAKLLDESDDKSTAISRVSEQDSSVPNEENRQVLANENISKRRLEEVFSKFNGDDTEVRTEEDDGVETKFRSYEELQKEFEDLKMSIKTDSEIISELWERLKVANQVDEIVTILTDLEYLLHQTDNAVNFAKAGGFASVILPAINSSNSQVAVAALRLLGSASQSNPKVQIAALEVGVVEKVLRLVRNTELSSAALYALSCVIRRFPLAQKTFVQHGGLGILASLFDDSYNKGKTIAKDASKIWRAKVKAVSLLHDLMLEQQQADEEAHKQYTQIGLKEQIYSNDWCALFPSLLTALDDHDAAEKGAEAMLAIWDVCQTQFLQAAPVILEAEKHYFDLSKREIDGDIGDGNNSDELRNGYFTSMSNLISKLAERIRSMKDEL